MDWQLKGYVLFVLLLVVTPEMSAETIKAKSRLQLYVATTESLELKDLIAAFAQSEKFEVRDVGASLPPRQGQKALYLVLARDSKLEISVTDFVEPGRFLIGFYELQPDPEFDRVMSKFESMLRQRWPDRVTPYTGL